MSIYASLGSFGFPVRYPDNVEGMVNIWIQGVPAHINYEGPEWEWLPPPIPENSDFMRAVVFVEEGTGKGTDRCGQEYKEPILILSGLEFASIPFPEVMEKIAEHFAGKGKGK